MNKYFECLCKDGSQEFKPPQKWAEESKRGNDSTHSGMYDIKSDSAYSLKSRSGKLNAIASSQKFQVLEEEIYKKSFELSCYKSKFCETITQYEKKIKGMQEILVNTILNVNEILQNLKQNFVEVEQFQDGEDQNDPQLKEQKVFQYLESKLQLICQQTKENYEPEKYSQLNEYAQKQQKKIFQLIDYINKKNEYTEQLKKKIDVLRTQRNQVKTELEHAYQVINEASSLEENLELKYMNRKELTNILKSLLRRIVFHEKHCKEGKKLAAETINKVNKAIRLKSDQKGNSSSSMSPTKRHYPPKSPSSKKLPKAILTLE